MYKEHLKEVQTLKEIKQRKERLLCDIDFKRNNDHLNKSVTSYYSVVREKHSVDEITERNLNEVENRINEGWHRSLMKKDELRTHAAETLHKLSIVRENHSKIVAKTQNERLSNYI